MLKKYFSIKSWDVEKMEEDAPGGGDPPFFFVTGTRDFILILS